MKIRQRLTNHTLDLADKIRVRDVRIGLGYTAVCLEDGRIGVAYTFREEANSGCTVFNGLRPLAGRRASELIRLFESPDRISSAVALATVNALKHLNQTDFLSGDILDHLQLEPKDRLAMIGNFVPLVPIIRKKVADLYVFTEEAVRAEGYLPSSAIPDYIPTCDVLLITGTSIVNGTIDHILSAVATCREVAILGASTPLFPEVFSDTPVTLLSGIHIVNPDAILQIVSEGGGMRVFRKDIKKINLRI